ncbi:MAG: tyrosine-type recombinase/integrase, partial [Desulfobacteraceae bacterium]
MNGSQPYLLKLKQKNYSPKSIDLYECAINRFNAWLKANRINRYQDVTCDHVSAYRRYLVRFNLSDATLYVYLRTVKMLFDYLEENRSVFINPAGRFTVPKYRHRLKHVPTRKDIETLLLLPDVNTPVGVRDRALIEVLYSTGIRRAEAFGLTIFDPDVTGCALRVIGKGDKERMVPLGRQAVYWLKRYMERARPKLCRSLNIHALWISKNSGQQLSYCRVDKLIRGYAKQVGIKGMSIHAIRRACTTHMLQNGAQDG